jgi:hypothetical protein
MPTGSPCVTAKELRLDYFKIYDVEDRRAEGKVLLNGQFDRREQPVQLALREFFANPVSKNGEPLYDKNAHLAWYPGLQSREPIRRVVRQNQFGKIQIWIGTGSGLLVPTQKVERGSKFPEALDHYKIYPVVDGGKTLDLGLKLIDQFGTDKAKLRAPGFLAVPVAKRHSGKVYPIQDDRAHLLVFDITPHDFEKKVQLQNQVANDSVVVVRSVMLATPSIKLEWK